MEFRETLQHALDIAVNIYAGKKDNVDVLVTPHGAPTTSMHAVPTHHPRCPSPQQSIDSSTMPIASCKTLQNVALQDYASQSAQEAVVNTTSELCSAHGIVAGKATYCLLLLFSLGQSVNAKEAHRKAPLTAAKTSQLYGSLYPLVTNHCECLFSLSKTHLTAMFRCRNVKVWQHSRTNRKR
eukprot:6189171-Amphidinium_carterae.2